MNEDRPLLDDKLSAAYRKASAERSPPALDDQILTLSRKPGIRPRGRWMQATALAATAVLTFGVVLQLRNASPDPESEVARPPRFEEAAPVPTGAEPAGQENGVASEPERLEEEFDGRNSPVDVDDHVDGRSRDARPPPESAPPAGFLPTMPAPGQSDAAPISVPQETEARPKSQSSAAGDAAGELKSEPNPAQFREEIRRQADAQAREAATMLRSQEKNRAAVASGNVALQSNFAASANDTCRDARDDADQWSKCILALEAAGLTESAEIERAALRERFPDFVHPTEE